MLVRFRKTGPRRYAVLVERERAPSVVAHPAPGYDEYLPHDLLHFVAEAEWGLDGAVFGQLAAGGDPGVFLPADKELVPAWMRARKLRRRPRPRGRRSELLAGILEDAWNARHGRGRLPEGWDERLAAARVEQERLDFVVASLDGLAERWQALPVGGSLTLEWRRAPRSRHRRAERRRPSRAVRR
jgi:hypothetical protein